MRGALLLTLLLAVSCLASDPNPAAIPSVQLALTAADGRPVTPLGDRGQKATVLLFLMHDCPVTNATAPELNRLAAEFGPQGVEFFGVYATETEGEIRTHLHNYSLPFAGLLDASLQLARYCGATRMPEAAIYSPSGELLYRGRIDDRALKPGLTRPAPTRRDLHLALKAVLAGHSPQPRFTPAVGCYLPVH